MRYQISGKQIDIGVSLQTHAKEALGVVIEKYAQRANAGTVTFSFSKNASPEPLGSNGADKLYEASALVRALEVVWAVDDRDQALD